MSGSLFAGYPTHQKVSIIFFVLFSWHVSIIVVEGLGCLSVSTTLTLSSHLLTDHSWRETSCESVAISVFYFNIHRLYFVAPYHQLCAPCEQFPLPLGHVSNAGGWMRRQAKDSRDSRHHRPIRSNLPRTLFRLLSSGLRWHGDESHFSLSGCNKKYDKFVGVKFISQGSGDHRTGKSPWDAWALSYPPPPTTLIIFKASSSCSCLPASQWASHHDSTVTRKFPFFFFFSLLSGPSGLKRWTCSALSSCSHTVRSTRKFLCHFNPNVSLWCIPFPDWVELVGQWFIGSSELERTNVTRRCPEETFFLTLSTPTIVHASNRPSQQFVWDKFSRGVKQINHYYIKKRFPSDSSYNLLHIIRTEHCFFGIWILDFGKCEIFVGENWQTDNVIDNEVWQQQN